MSKITTIKCDRCGREFDKYSQRIGLAIVKAHYDEDKIYIRGAENQQHCFDICEKCQESLKYWFKYTEIDLEIQRQRGPIPI